MSETGTSFREVKLPEIKSLIDGGGTAKPLPLRPIALPVGIEITVLPVAAVAATSRAPVVTAFTRRR